jgi:O-acetyl-ADP-ribose deacetylase (regulator of RNase III)
MKPIHRPFKGLERPPILRCTDCSYILIGRRRIEPRRIRFFQTRTSVWEVFEFDGDRCPHDGTALVEKCGCGEPLAGGNDERCRRCGRPFSWAATSERQKEVEQWARPGKYVGSIHSIAIYVIRGTIAYTSADAVVSCDNEDGEMASSSAAALKDRGGWDVEQESMSEPRELGTAWLTSPGLMPVGRILHIGVLDDEGKTTPGITSRAVAGAIDRARRENIQTVAMPPLAIDRGLNLEESVRATTLGFIAAGSGKAINVVIVVLGEQEYKSYRDALKRHLAPPKELGLRSRIRKRLLGADR